MLPLKKLQLMTIGENSISGTLPRMDMPNLQFALFGQNKIEDISNLPHSNIPNVIFIKLYHNRIKKVP